MRGQFIISIKWLSKIKLHLKIKVSHKYKIRRPVFSLKAHSWLYDIYTVYKSIISTLNALLIMSTKRGLWPAKMIFCAIVSDVFNFFIEVSLAKELHVIVKILYHNKIK